MKTETSSIWKGSFSSGLIAGALCVLVSLVGLVESFGDTYIVHGLITLGDFILLIPIALIAYSTMSKASNLRRTTLLGVSAILGAVAGFLLTLLILIGLSFPGLRDMFINASPALFSQLMRGVPLPLGALVPPLQGVIAALIGLGILLIPARPRSAVIQGILWVVFLGTLRDQVLIIDMFKPQPIAAVLKSVVFSSSGLNPIGAALVFAISAGLSYYLSGRKKTARVSQPTNIQKRNRIILIFILAAILLVLPYTLGIFFSEILDTTGLFIMMGLGLNIVVGFAGLLDLGYVAFYAIGAYTMGVLTTGGFEWTFWQALPIALMVTWLAGFILGLPVLRMRGDYLAIVTLGFGEIVRLLVLSDWLKDTLGGTQGIQSIAQPVIGPLYLVGGSAGCRWGECLEQLRR